MDAPTYPPATAFEPPVAAPYELSVESASLADLIAFVSSLFPSPFAP